MNIHINIIDLTPKQESIANSIISTPASETKYHVLRASRQSGKTYLIERLAVYFALLKSNLKVAFVNAQHKQNKKVFEEMMNFLPQKLITKAINNDDRHIRFINNSIIQFYTAKNYNSVVGATFDYFVGDEFAIWPIMAWDYIQPTVAARKNAKVILSSTPRGKNQFYDVCMLGQSTDPFYKEHRMLYSDNPYYDLREVEQAKKNRMESVWRQEYMGEFVFGKSAVFGDLTRFQTIHKWEDPKPNLRYFLGLDIAGTGADETILTIIDQNGKVVYIYETEATAFPAQARELEGIIRKYQAEGFGECNGLGRGLVDILQEKGLSVHDYWTSNQSKNDAVTLIIKGMANNDVMLPDIELCSKLDNEMSMYAARRLSGSGNLSYSHPKGLHDDYVDSLLIAYAARQQWMFGGSDTYVPEEYEDTSPVTDYDNLTFRQLRDLEGAEFDPY